MKKKHIGSSFDDFLKEERVFEQTQTLAVKRVLAWQIAEFARFHFRDPPDNNEGDQRIGRSEATKRFGLMFT